MRTLLLLPLLVAAGCGGGDLGTHEGCVDAEIKAMHDFAAILEGIKDKEGVEAARPKVEAVVRRVEEIRAAGKKLGDPSADEQKRLKAKTDAAQKELEPRLQKAGGRLQNDPEAIMALAALMAEFEPRLRR